MNSLSGNWHAGSLFSHLLLLLLERVGDGVILASHAERVRVKDVHIM
jgi:hypothetical protein